jgi:uridine kinase
MRSTAQAPTRELTPVLRRDHVSVDTFFSGGDDTYWRTRTPRQRNAEVIDWQRLRAEALEPLRAGLTARWRPFDYDAWEGLAAEPIVLGPAPVVLVEGAYSAGPWLADAIDLAVPLTLDLVIAAGTRLS